MDPATKAVLEFFAKQVAGLIFSSLKAKLFDKATDDMKELVAQQAKFELSVKSMLAEQKTYDAAFAVMEWSKMFREHLQSAKNKNLDPLNDFLKEMKGATKIRFEMDKLYAGLVGDDPTGGKPKSAISAWHDAVYPDLADDNKLDYTVISYVDALQDRLNCCLRLFQNGFMILVATADEQEQAERWADEWNEKITKICKAVYNTYPPAVKLMKPAYDLDWAHQETRWRFSSGEQNLSYITQWPTDNKVLDVQPYGDDRAEWVLSPGITSGLVGLKNCHTDSRVGMHYYPKTYIEGVEIWDYELQELGGGDPAVYKLIPYIDSASPDAPVVRLIGPIKESGDKKSVSQLIRDPMSDGSRIGNHRFILHDNGK